MSRIIGLDLGTSNIRIYLPKKGIVVDEPNVVAISTNNNQPVAVGQEAKTMLGRTPETLIASYPLAEGAISSYQITKRMLEIYLNKILGRIRIFKPEIIVSVPVGATSTEKKAVLDAVESSGAKRALLVKSPIAAALGAQIDIFASSGNMVIDVGGGKTEVAVISLGDIVSFSSARIGGKNMDTAITNNFRKKRNLLVGEQTAEVIKEIIGSSIIRKKEVKMEVSGSNTLSGLPESVMVSSHEVTQALKVPLNDIILSVKQVLQKTPPELSSDVMDKGMVICGGASKLNGFEQMMTKVTGVPCQSAEEEDLCVIKGIGTICDNKEQFEEQTIWRKK